MNKADSINYESFKGIDPETFLNYVGDTAKAPSSLTRYNQAGVQLLPRRSLTFVDGKRTFYHPLSLVEFLTADYLNKGKLAAKKTKRNLTQLQNEDIFFARISAYFLALSNLSNSTEALTRFSSIVKNECPLLSAFMTRTDIVNGRHSYVAMDYDSLKKLYAHNFNLIVNSLQGNRGLADAYIKWITELYIHAFLKVYDAEWDKISLLSFVEVLPSSEIG